MVVTSC